DVDIHDVAVLEHLVARYAVADDVIHRGADGGGEGGIARRRIAYGCRLDLEFVGNEIHAQPVELAGSDSGAHMGLQVVQGGGGCLAGGAHFVQIGGVSD